MNGPQAPLLELRNLVVRYGSITALHGINLTVQAGELVTLLGANGAGKSTTRRAIAGWAGCPQNALCRLIMCIFIHMRGKGFVPGQRVQECAATHAPIFSC